MTSLSGPMTPTAPFTQIKLQLHMGRTYQEQNRRRTHPSTQPRLQRMKACGIQPTRQVLDNEISAAYKLAITASGMTYQLVPPDDHRRNIAEKAIQTWKDHFIAAISGTDAKFPPPLVPITTTNGTPTLPSTAIQCIPPHFLPYASLRPS
eukprot:CCRYP_016929-RA/>CCRYP_016929-RA protein AED:0.40 eAED:0.44 QI:0/0/0/1/0/0/2/0/149